MEINFKFQGLATAPSDYSAPDGSLALCQNLINEDGEMRPINAPTFIKNVTLPNTKVFVHKGSDFGVHYICVDQHRLYWRDTNFQQSTNATILNGVAVTDVCCLGNVLSINTAKGITYAIWRESGYVVLGARPPRLNIAFGLTGVDPKPEYQNFNINTATSGLSTEHLEKICGNDYLNFVLSGAVEELYAEFSKTIISQLTKHLHNIAEDGKLVDPFFIRAAYRLFDGTHCWHTPPVLLTPNVSGPMLHVTSTYYNSTTKTIECRYDNNVCDITMDLLGFDVEQLRIWKDIIVGIDVFISKPMTGVDLNKPVQGICKRAKLHRLDFSVGNSMSADSLRMYGMDGIGALYKPTMDSYWSDRCIEFKTPFNTLQKQAQEVCNFYLYAHVPFDNIWSIIGCRQDISKYVVLENLLPEILVNSTTLTDDLTSHRDLSPRVQFVYNDRINYANIKYIAPNPFSLKTCAVETFYGEGERQEYKIMVLLKKNGGTVRRAYDIENNDVSRIGDICKQENFPVYIFYPDPDAYEMQIEYQGKVCRIDLKKHDFLNGAYWLRQGSSNAFNSGQINNYSTGTYASPSKIHVSEATNPFKQIVSSTVSLGTAKILGLGVASRALSEGQFGQFPLYAFTDAGVWAVSVSDTGTYVAKQPISQDVCINPDGITAIDTAVLFPTDRGVMMASGSSVTCVSDCLNDVSPFNVNSLPGIKETHDRLLGHSANDTCLDSSALRLFLRECFMVYDYPHSRVYIGNYSYDTSMVYSLKSGMWSVATIGLHSAIRNYPSAMAITKDGSVIDFATSNKENPVVALAVTRPLKLNAPDIHKAVNEFYVRGNFNPAHVGDLYLHASNDLRNWKLLAKSNAPRMRGIRGSGWKYYRIGFAATLDADESISGVTGQATPKYTNHMR